MQIETTMRYHFTTTRMDIMFKTEKMESVDKDV